MGTLIRTCAVLALVALAGCQSASGTFCDIARPQRPSAAAVDAMTDAQVREMLAQNLKGQRLCGWRP